MTGERRRDATLARIALGVALIVAAAAWWGGRFQLPPEWNSGWAWAVGRVAAGAAMTGGAWLLATARGARDGDVDGSDEPGEAGAESGFGEIDSRP